ncbi:MAG: helix-turn-helix domain-containing protein [Ruminococcus callidus]|nr:helix-turn-helix domain-containing protein [Ruminococcus callidus]
MSFNLMTVFKSSDLKQFGQNASNIVSLAFKTNKKTGARIARAVLDNGMTLIKTVTATGVEVGKVINIPSITSVAQRNNVIVDLAKNKFTQEQIAAMLNISQSTVSNVLRK